MRERANGMRLSFGERERERRKERERRVTPFVLTFSPRQPKRTIFRGTERVRKVSGKCFRGDQVLFFRFVTLSVESLIQWPVGVREKPDETLR